MPYAANGQISTDELIGGVQITDAQYAAAIDGLIAGKLVTIDGGFAIIDPPQPEPPPAPEPKPPTLDDYKAAFDAHLDTVAQERQYDNRLTITTYVTSSNPQWAAEASAFIAWRDVALGSMFIQLAVVQAGATPPTIAEFIAALPVIVWP